MSLEEDIQKKLIEKFPFLEGQVRIQRERRMFAEVPLDKFLNVFAFAYQDLDFPYLGTITGLDEGATLGFMYHLIAKGNGIMLTLVTHAPKENPVVPTITGTFPGAELYERELSDLLGTKVEGLAEGRRYPLPEDWPQGQYPLRKDWQPAGAEPQQKTEAK